MIIWVIDNNKSYFSLKSLGLGGLQFYKFWGFMYIYVDSNGRKKEKQNSNNKT